MFSNREWDELCASHAPEYYYIAFKKNEVEMKNDPKYLMP